jgi:hypothetical protein
MSATYSSFTVIGQREDLSDVIYDISPQDTPIMSSIGKSKATAVYHEWHDGLPCCGYYCQRTDRRC